MKFRFQFELIEIYNEYTLGGAVDVIFLKLVFFRDEDNTASLKEHFGTVASSLLYKSCWKRFKKRFFMTRRWGISDIAGFAIQLM